MTDNYNWDSILETPLPHKPPKHRRPSPTTSPTPAASPSSSTSSPTTSPSPSTSSPSPSLSSRSSRGSGSGSDTTCNSKRLLWLRTKQRTCQFFNKTFTNSSLAQELGFEKVEMHADAAKWWAALQKSQEQVQKLSLELQHHLAQLKATQTSCTSAAAALSAFYADSADGDDNKSAAELSSSKAFDAASDHALATTVRNQTLAASLKEYEQRVVEPLNFWLADFAVLAPALKELERKQLVSDYYTKKLLGLRVDADIKRAQYKQTEKDDARIARNEAKYRDARADYAAFLRETLATMARLEQQKEDTVAGAVTAHASLEAMRLNVPARG